MDGVETSCCSTQLCLSHSLRCRHSASPLQPLGELFYLWITASLTCWVKFAAVTGVSYLCYKSRKNNLLISALGVEWKSKEWSSSQQDWKLKSVIWGVSADTGPFFTDTSGTGTHSNTHTYNHFQVKVTAAVCPSQTCEHERNTLSLSG